MEVTDIYISSNGDRWRLIHDGEMGRYIVQHKPNLSSGGKTTESTTNEFLEGSGTSPQAEALRALLESKAAVEK